VIVRPEGYIVTNDHVVEDAKGGNVTVTLADGTEYPGTVIHDDVSDLAIVQIKAKKPLPFVKFADSRQLKVGQWAVAIGSPFGQNNTMTTGIVSALSRKATIQSRPYPELIQTDASINPGNSGGPLLNIKGELIGVNVAIDSPTGTSAGIGFAIPANRAKDVVEQLVSKGKVTRGYLGLTPDPVTPEIQKALGVTKGAIIRTIAANSPAQKAGLEVGDVVTRIGERSIEDEYAFRDAIAHATPGQSIALFVVRDGSPLTLKATPGERPAATSDSGTMTKPRAPKAPGNTTGLSFEALSEKDRADFGKTAQGVFITAVRRGSPAATSGLQPGLLIIAANNQKITTPAALTTLLASAKSGDVFVLRVMLPEVDGQPGERRLAYLNVP
jgi:serine protease Do